MEAADQYLTHVALDLLLFVLFCPPPAPCSLLCSRWIHLSPIRASPLMSMDSKNHHACFVLVGKCVNYHAVMNISILLYVAKIMVRRSKVSLHS